jgi:two-component system, chemotaxis family, chemotaxis protein CheY
MTDYANMRLLLIDDTKAMRTVIRTILTKIGFTKIIEAEDGEHGLEIVKGPLKFDIIVSDWNMPKKTGLELLKEVRAIAGMEKTPFLMVTTEAERDNLQAAIAAGVTAFIKKPFQPQVLHDKLNEIFAGK